MRFETQENYQICNEMDKAVRYVVNIILETFKEINNVKLFRVSACKRRTNLNKPYNSVKLTRNQDKLFNSIRLLCSVYFKQCLWIF